MSQEGINEELIEAGPNQRIILEIGTEDWPIFHASKERVTELERDGNFYIGVEIDKGQLKKASQITKRSHSSIADKALFIEADGTKLPLKTESVEEVVLGNVLGDPSIFKNVIHGILDEAHRVLKRGGLLKIVETATPSYGRNILESLLPSFEDEFEVEKTLRYDSEELKGDKDWLWVDNGMKSGFVCFLKKRSNA
jgi:SAM-dependent methyltransferase